MGDGTEKMKTVVEGRGKSDWRVCEWHEDKGKDKGEGGESEWGERDPSVSLVKHQRDEDQGSPKMNKVEKFTYSTSTAKKQKGDGWLGVPWEMQYL